MNTAPMAQGNMRRATTILFASTGAVLVVLFLFWLRPARRERELLVAEMEEVERRMTPYLARSAEMPLERQVTRERQTHERLRAEQDRLLKRLHTFGGGSPLMAMIPSPEEGRIDFKVALFNARTILGERAREASMLLPPGLGMEEAIGAAEDAETRLWQLATVVRLVENGLRLGLPAIDHIQPLKPLVHPLTHEQVALLREYPIRVRFQASYEQILSFIDALLEEEALFTLRRFRAERAGWEQGDSLVVEVVCGAGLPRPHPLPGDVPGGEEAAFGGRGRDRGRGFFEGADRAGGSPRPRGLDESRRDAGPPLPGAEEEP